MVGENLPYTGLQTWFLDERRERPRDRIAEKSGSAGRNSGLYRPGGTGKEIVYR